MLVLVCSLLMRNHRVPDFFSYGSSKDSLCNSFINNLHQSDRYMFSLSKNTTQNHTKPLSSLKTYYLDDLVERKDVNSWII